MTEENKQSTTDTTNTTTSPATEPVAETTTEAVATTTASDTPEVQVATESSVPTPAPTPTPASTTPVVHEATPAVPTTTATEGAAAPKQPIAWKPYALAIIVVAMMGAGLLFLLEQQGRTNTTYFSGITKMMEGPAASVNGVAIPRNDFDRNFAQVMREVEAQGFGTELAPEMEATLKEQAIQSLVNAELLKQAAEEAGISTTDEQLQARMAEIETGNGGPEQLAARMAEFGVTMEQLQIDVKRELLIEAHLEAAVDLESIVVTDEEVAEVYNQVALENAGTEIPPLAEVIDLLRDQIVNERQQQLIGAYIETLRQAAEIEINV